MARQSPLRRMEERNAIVVQWINLPGWVVKKMGAKHPAVRKLGHDDAVQQGMVALIRAAESWREEQGAFSTYAEAAIRFEIIDAGNRYAAIKIPNWIFRANRRMDVHREERRADASRVQFVGRLPRTWDLAAPKSSSDKWQSLLRDTEGLLNERERWVLEARAAGRVLSDIRKDLNITKQRVKQIADRAIEKIREAVG